MVNTMTITEFTREISGISSALIFSHARPDGDTIGCAMALKKALESLNIKADMICPAVIPQKYKNFPLVGEF